MRAAVFAERPAVGVPDGSGIFGAAGSRLVQVCVDETGIVAVGHETDFVALGFLCDGQLEILREGADFGFGESAQPAQGPSRLRLGQAPEEICLVLRKIEGGAHLPAAGPGVLRNAGIVSGGDCRRAYRIREIEELIELDESVAERAGNRGPARKILVYERLDDALFKLPLQVDDVVGHSDMLGHAAGVVDVVEGTASAGGLFGLQIGETSLVPELHGQAGDVAAFALEQRGDGGAVYTAGHGDCDQLRHAQPPVRPGRRGTVFGGGLRCRPPLRSSHPPLPPCWRAREKSAHWTAPVRGAGRAQEGHGTAQPRRSNRRSRSKRRSPADRARSPWFRLRCRRTGCSKCWEGETLQSRSQQSSARATGCRAPAGRVTGLWRSSRNREPPPRRGSRRGAGD